MNAAAGDVGLYAAVLAAWSTELSFQGHRHRRVTSWSSDRQRRVDKRRRRACTTSYYIHLYSAFMV